MSLPVAKIGTVSVFIISFSYFSYKHKHSPFQLNSCTTPPRPHIPTYPHTYDITKGLELLLFMLIDSIAYEKAAIIKRKAPVSGNKQPDTRNLQLETLPYILSPITCVSSLT